MLRTVSPRVRGRVLLVLAVAFGALAMHGLSVGCAGGGMVAGYSMSVTAHIEPAMGASSAAHGTPEVLAAQAVPAIRSGNAPVARAGAAISAAARATAHVTASMLGSAHMAHEICTPDLPPRDAGTALPAALVALFGPALVLRLPGRPTLPDYRGPPPRSGSATLIALCVSRR